MRLLTVHSLGERLRLLTAKLVPPLARQSPPSSAAAESQHSLVGCHGQLREAVI